MNINQDKLTNTWFFASTTHILERLREKIENYGVSIK